MSQEQVNRIYKVDDKHIYGFFEEHRFLSNYHVTPITWEGLTYGSTEAAYHAAKCTFPGMRDAFTAMTPSESKKEGR